jgi:hypothetical protein
VEGADQRSRLAGLSWLWATVGVTGCALAIVVLLAPPADATPIRALSWLLFTGSSVHVASTAWLFFLPTVRKYAREHATRCVWIPAGLIAGAATAAAIIPPAAFQWLLLPYFGWQFYHYQKQNIGIAALAAAAHRVAPMSKGERRPLLVSGVATVGALAADPRLLSLRVNLAVPWLGAATTVLFDLALAAGGFALARRPAAARPAGFCAVYLTCLLFGLPAFVFASPYAAVGGMTVAHGLQYLLLICMIAGGNASDRGPSRLVRLALLANVALLGGALLSAASHLHNSSYVGRFAFGAYLGVVMTHFVVDAGIWRLRDPLARRFVMGSLPYLMPAATLRPSSLANEPEPAVRETIHRQPI